MSFPEGVETVEVTAGTAGYRGLDGTVYAGGLRFTPSVARVVSAEHGVIALGPVNVALGASGEFTQELLATDAAGFEPSGWTYRVDEEFTSAPGRAYNVSLPASTPTVALPSLSPVESSSGTVSSPAVLSVNGESGVVVLDAADVGAVTTSRQVTAGTGLSGGGTLAADRTLNVVYGASASTACQGNDARLSDARTPLAHAASHGSGGGDPITIAQSQVSGLTVDLAAKAATTYVDSTFATQATVSTLNGYVDDTIDRVAAIEQGTAFLSALNVAGSAQVVGDLTVTDFVKGYRFRVSGAALDLEATGTDLIVSNWSGSGFNGTQRSYLRLSADAQNVQVAGKVEFVDGLYGATRHVLDGAANTVGFYGASPAAKPTVSGSLGGNAALGSLIAALATLGLITDSTSA
ncbi:hypothetical protein [Streptomyces antibioticus]|uniref:hypothetical protein n=1 Tax=Streptomyces antibioticus TaxID=1890 RepID=UPI0033DD86EB